MVMLVFMSLYLIMNKFYTLKQDVLLAMDFLEKGTGLNASVKPHVILKSCDQNDESCGFDRISRPNGNGIILTLYSIFRASNLYNFEHETHLSK